MFDVLPSFYEARSAEELERYDGQAFGNFLLRTGEVRRLIYPEDKDSRSKQFLEYDVYVQHRENNTAVSAIYTNCLHQNSLAGFADKLVMTLRVDPSTAVTKDGQQNVVDGVGSKVLILCLNGEHAAGLIVGGVRDVRDSDKGRKAKGHHLEFVFNGVQFQVNDDGSYRVTMGGKTAASGQLDASADKAGAGTYLEVQANGTWRVATKDAKQAVTIDHKAGTIRVEATKDLTLVADNIRLGDKADEQAVLGNTLVKLMGQILDGIATLTVNTPVGTSSPPNNAVLFRRIKSQLKTALSEFVRVKKKKR